MFRRRIKLNSKKALNPRRIKYRMRTGLEIKYGHCSKWRSYRIATWVSHHGFTNY